MKGPGANEELRQSGKILKELNAELMERKELELPTGEKGRFSTSGKPRRLPKPIREKWVWRKRNRL